MHVKISDGTINVVESGSKSDLPALIFLHYFGGSSVSWRKVTDALRDDHYCLALDLRGFGESQDTPPNYDLEDYTRDVLELLDFLKLENFSLIGHSMGGKIAFAVAANQPPNLNSLILLAPSPPSPEPMQEEDRKRLLSAHGTPDAARETIKKASHRKIAGAVFADAVSADLQSNEKAWKAWLENGSRRDISDFCDLIKVPVVAAVGEKDENMTYDLIEREIVRRVPNSKLEVIKDAGHLLPLEAPEKIARFIKKAVAI